MNAYGGCFASLNDRKDAILFCFIKPDNKDMNKTDLFIVEVGNPDKSKALKIQANVPLKNNNDFVTSMVSSNKFSCLYAVTQQGLLFIFDVRSGKCIIQHTFPNVSWNQLILILQVTFFF